MAEQTTDYKQFKLMPGNRRVVKAHVKNLAQSMALYPEIFQLKPILVNKHYEVIDGQHRLAAAKQLKVPVWYEKVGDVGANEAVIINNNQRNWSMLDYARSYAAFGNEEYKAFLRIRDKFPTLPIYTIMRYIGSKMASGSVKFRNGEFKADMIQTGEVYLEMLDELAEIYPRFAYHTPSQAVYRAFMQEGYDHDRMLKKLNMVPEGMVKLNGTNEEILRNLEDIYNFRQQQDVKRFY